MEGLLQHLQQVKEFFASGKTKEYNFRKEALLKLRKALVSHEEDLMQALYIDLKKNKEESWVTEIGFLHAEI
ncbi:MAG TPA: aldehyde dehydrogenase family protein, partial [Flavisolibacter sp.]|nr:aldehyde dehydrogenase family protein [Flavisolibacter sp.]